jgi:hypothetical protein
MRKNDTGGTWLDHASVDPTITEADIDEMMADPRYWRDRDPAIVEKVREDIRQMHGE